jgi:hypothetical protein
MAQIRSPRGRQDEETDPATAAVSGAQARPERRPPVGTRSNLGPAPKMLPQKRATASALVLERHRRHRDKDVIGHEATSGSRSADTYARTNGSIHEGGELG